MKRGRGEGRGSSLARFSQIQTCVDANVERPVVPTLRTSVPAASPYARDRERPPSVSTVNVRPHTRYSRTPVVTGRYRQNVVPESRRPIGPGLKNVRSSHRPKTAVDRVTATAATARTFSTLGRVAGSCYRVLQPRRVRLIYARAWSQCRGSPVSTTFRPVDEVISRRRRRSGIVYRPERNVKYTKCTTGKASVFPFLIGFSTSFPICRENCREERKTTSLKYNTHAIFNL